MKKTTLYLMLFVFAFAANIIVAQTLPAPDSLSATVTYNGPSASIKLTWKSSGSSSVRYNVYSTSDTSEFKRRFSGVYGTYVNDYQVERGKTYKYYVVAYSGNTTSAPSQTVTVVVTPLTYAWVYGTITRDSNNAPIRRACVQLLPVSATTSSTCNTGGMAYTDSLGNYAIRVTSGQYVAYFSAYGFVSEYYNNKSTLQTADKFTLGANDSTAVNAGLAAPVPPVYYYLSGKITDTNNAVVKAYVTAFVLRANSYHTYQMKTVTDNDGGYKFKLLKNDTAIVYAQASYSSAFYPEYYNNKRTFGEADRIAMSSDVTGINLALDRKPVVPNGISGKVKDSLGVGVKAHVSAYLLRNGFVSKTYVALADSLGAYAFGNIIGGKYILKVVPMNNFRPTYFKYDGTQTLNWRNADSVVVDSLHVTANINFTVVPRSDSGHATIHGNISVVNRSVVPGGFVYALNTSGKVASFAVSDANGNYKMDDLAPGMYTIVSDATNYQATMVTNVTSDYNANSLLEVPITIVPDGVTEVAPAGAVPSSFVLEQNYPNPFNPSTTIRYSVAEKAQVKLAVYDFLGREAAVLVNGEQAQGNYSVEFNAAKLSSGVYFYKLTSGNVSLTKKLILMK